MSNLIAASSFDDVYQFDTADPIQGGPGGIDNQPHQQLANRTQWLKDNQVSKAQPVMTPAVTENGDIGVYRIGLDLGHTDDATSGTYSLIPLCRADAAVSGLIQSVSGTFRMVRGSGGAYNSYQSVEVVAQRAYNGSTGGFRHLVGATASQPCKLVTASIGGIAYLCLTKGICTAQHVYFDGFSYDGAGDAVILTIVRNTNATNIADYSTAEFFGPSNAFKVDAQGNIVVAGTTISVGSQGVGALAVDSSGATYLRGGQVLVQNPAGSVTWLHVNSSGNIGVGTDGPVQKLHVYGSGAPTIRSESATNGVVTDFASDGNNAYGYLGTSSAHPLALGTAGTKRIVIDQSGQVNIGGLNAGGGYTLAVSGPLLFDQRPGLNGIFGTGSTSDSFLGNNNNMLAHYGLSWKTFTDGMNPTSGPQAALSGYGGVRLYTGGVLRLMVSVSGEFGLGRYPTPSYGLDVQGTIRSVGGEAATGYGLRVLNSTGDGGGYVSARAGAAQGIAIASDGGPMLFSSGSIPEVARFDTVGNLLIGRSGNQLSMNDLFYRSMAASGYQRLPGGMILQWGSTYIGDVISNQFTTYSPGFPVAFPNACRSVQMCYYDAAGVPAGINLQLVGMSGAGFSFQINETSSNIQNASVLWFAVGY